MASEPPRVARIETVITAEIYDADVLKHTAELQAATCACPMCNSLACDKVLSIRFEPRPIA